MNMRTNPPITLQTIGYHLPLMFFESSLCALGMISFSDMCYEQIFSHAPCLFILVSTFFSKNKFKFFIRFDFFIYKAISLY